jgi:hypothetical protein
MSDDTDERAVRGAMFQRLVGRGEFLAGLVEAWARRAPDEPLTHTLTCSPDTLVRLGLCLRPRDDHWDEDIAELARHFGLDVDRLAGFVRRALVAETFVGAPAVDPDAPTRLLAARDRDED